MSQRFCTACGAALGPGAAFCSTCGTAVAGPPPPSAAAPVQPPVPMPQPAAPPAYQPPAYQSPAPAAYQPPAPAHGYANWSSVEVQPGERSLGSWMVGIRTTGPDVTGTLTITDRRMLFKPKVAGVSIFMMLVSQLPSFKRRHTVVLGKDRIAAVHSEAGMVNTHVVVTTVDGGVYRIIRGLMSVEPILAAFEQR